MSADDRTHGAPPSRRPAERGFAMLAALLVVVVAAVFAGVALAAAAGALEVGAHDGGRVRARVAADAGVDLAVHRLRWALLRPGTSLTCQVSEAPAGAGGEGEEGQAADVRIELTAPIVPDPGLPDWAVRITSTARCGRATSIARSVVALVPGALPLGLSVAADADVRAPLAVSGSGLYVGGALRGRDLVSFAAPPASAGAPPASAGMPPDFVRGDRWPAAGVHAGAGIWAAGVEVHELDPLPDGYAADTDPHTGAEPGDGDDPVEPVPAAWVEPPAAVWLAAARRHALAPAGALADGVLRLDGLPPVLPGGEPSARELAGVADPASGYLVVVSSRAFDGGLVVVGRRDPAWAPVTLVVDGDAVLGQAGATGAAVAAGVPAVALRGALIVTGHLEIAATTSLAGHLACRRLVVAAPLSLSVPSDWRATPPLGSLEPVLLARE